MRSRGKRHRIKKRVNPSRNGRNAGRIASRRVRATGTTPVRAAGRSNVRGQGRLGDCLALIHALSRRHECFAAASRGALPTANCARPIPSCERTSRAEWTGLIAPEHRAHLQHASAPSGAEEIPLRARITPDPWERPSIASNRCRAVNAQAREIRRVMPLRVASPAESGAPAHQVAVCGQRNLKRSGPGASAFLRVAAAAS